LCDCVGFNLAKGSVLTALDIPASRPFCNRVQIDGSIIATTARGLFMGNRGRLHTADQRLGNARWSNKSWITCSLAYPRDHRKIWGDGYTELFFLDEAIALSAGHRPCAQCRRQAYDLFREAWFVALGERPLAPAIDARMHSDRIDPLSGGQKRHQANLDQLPDGTCIRVPGTSEAALVLGGRLLQVRPDGYGEALERPVNVVATFSLQGAVSPS
jgi:hypothetical protein